MTTKDTPQTHKPKPPDDDPAPTTGSWSLIRDTPLPVDGHDVLVCQMPGGRQMVAHWDATLRAVDVDGVGQVSATHWTELPPLPTDQAAAPTLTSLDPTTAVLGSASFTLRCLGSGFAEGAQILFNGYPEPTTVVSDSEVTTAVDMGTAEVAMPIPVLVRNPDGQQTETQMFTFTAPEPETATSTSAPAPETRKFEQPPEAADSKHGDAEGGKKKEGGQRSAGETFRDSGKDKPRG